MSFRGGPSLLATFLTLSSALAVFPAMAETDHVEPPHGLESGHYHKNVLGVFAGVTHAGRRKNAPALGIEYERRISESFGIGGVAEYTAGDAEVWVALIPFSYRVHHWKFYVAPGIEDGHHGTEELVRLGGEYAFHLSGGWEIAPQVNVDIVDGEDVWVFGLVFARGF
jgi:hypothetical protein